MALGQLETFMASIRALESGNGDPKGNYRARGPQVSRGRYAGERAMGAYQIMPGNWPSWSKAAGIPGADWRDPAAQDRVARDQFKRLYSKYGRWDAVAVAWFAGQSRADKYVKGSDLSHVSDATAGHSGTNVPGYVQTIQGYMQKFASQYGGESDPEVDRLRQQARNVQGGGSAGGEPGYQDDGGSMEAYNPNPDIVGILGEDLAPDEEQKAQHPNPGVMLAGVLDSISARMAGGERTPVWKLGSLDREAPSDSNEDNDDGSAGQEEIV